MTMARRSRGAVAALGACLLLAGCGEGAPATQAAAAPAAPKKKKADAVVAPVVGVTGVEYAYNPINKRDPFRGLNIEAVARAAAMDESEDRQVCTEPLCKFDLDMLRVVAVVSGDSNPVAMVEDKGGVGHLVRRNTKMGTQGGKVTQILRDCLVVTSFISGPDSKAQAVKTNMCVTTDEKSKPPLDLLTGKVTQ